MGVFRMVNLAGIQTARAFINRMTHFLYLHSESRSTRKRMFSYLPSSVTEAEEWISQYSDGVKQTINNSK